jgi:hypothetical protein
MRGQETTKFYTLARAVNSVFDEEAGVRDG